MLTASWRGKGGNLEGAATAAGKAQAARYMAAFVRRVSEAHAPPPLWTRARAVNALRELGRFRDAERSRRTLLAGLTAEDRQQNWSSYLEKLAAPIARRDRSPEPLDMKPSDQIPFACESPERTLSRFDRAICARPEHQAAIGRFRTIRRRAEEIARQRNKR